MFKIFAALGHPTLGDFVTDALIASAVRELFDDAELYVYYRDDRPYKNDIVSCIPNARGLLRTSSADELLSIDAFEIASRTPVLPAKAFQDAGIPDTNLILTGLMLDQHALNAMPLPTLRPPPDRLETSDQALVDLGLDPLKWIATIYWKEPGYAYRGIQKSRLIYDPAPYVAVIHHLVEKLGGQVVRLGHPTATALPKLEGFVDLANVEDSHWLQLYAVSVSRFMLASASGPSAYGSAFGIPTVLTDHIEVTGVWRAHDYIVTQGFQESGKEYRQTAALEAGFLEGYANWRTKERPFKLRRNNARELIEAANEMFHSTTACLGWRSQSEGDVIRSRPNSVSLPLPTRRRTELLVPPSQRPKTPR